MRKYLESEVKLEIKKIPKDYKPPKLELKRIVDFFVFITTKTKTKDKVDFVTFQKKSHSAFKLFNYLVEEIEKEKDLDWVTISIGRKRYNSTIGIHISNENIFKKRKKK